MWHLCSSMMVVLNQRVISSWDSQLIVIMACLWYDVLEQEGVVVVSLFHTGMCSIVEVSVQR